MFNGCMGMAKVRRIAACAHRGQITAGGELFSVHLERIARMVGELDGSPVAQQTAWLYAVPSTGTSLADLTRQGISARVLRAVEALQPHDPGPTIDRVTRVKEAALVYYAVLVDQYRWPGRRVGFPDVGARLADQLGMPWPPQGAALRDVETEDLQAPAADFEGHWERLAPRLGRRGDVRAIPALFTGYQEVIEDAARRCCLAPLRGAIFAIVTMPANAGSPPVAELIERWWDSEDRWEAYTAVSALAAAGDPANRQRLLRKATAEDPGLVGVAIKGLNGDSEPREIAVLRSIVTRPGPEWRWARAAAATRLTAIGGPDADAALRQRQFGPVDPPWRWDRTWLRQHGSAAIPWLLERLPEPPWSFEATFALGEIRAVEAVASLCDIARIASYPVAQIEALGKIGSVEAGPTLVALLGHAHPDVRDHALRALNRIGGPDVADAAIAACDDPHPLVRDRAARVLVRHGDQSAVPQLIRLCDGRHAAAAANALTRIGDPRALPTLWHLFSTAHDRTTRHAAGRGLGRIDGPQQWLHSTDSHIQRAYIWLLGHKPNWHTKHQLEAAIRASDPIVRARAAEAYARLGDPANAELVKGLLTDPDPRVRANAATATGHLDQASAVNWLRESLSDPHPDVRSAAAAALRTGPRRP